MKKFDLSIVLMAAVLLMKAVPCFGLVSGTVTDALKNPVSGALITFTDESDSLRSFAAITEANGKYHIDIATSVNQEHDAASLPEPFLLTQNYPNPFNPTTIIPFTLSKPGYCTLSVYNIQGQKVCTLGDGYFSAGEHSVIWNGLDGRNRMAGAGIYLYQLRVGGKSETKKMLLLDGGVTGNYRSVSSMSETKKSEKIVANTYRVTITGDDIVPYKENGLVLSDAITYDFTVYRKVVYQGITFISIPEGTFQMGQVGVAEPVHSVSLSSFQISDAEITNAQYCDFLNAALAQGNITSTVSRVTGAKGTYSGREYIYLYGSSGESPCWITFSNNTFSVVSGFEDWPVVYVSWYGSKAFAEFYGCDLPREAEWENSCRGGKQYLYGTDDGTISKDTANYRWGSEFTQHPVNVKSYPNNPFGLYDLSGNVGEWCNDYYGDYSSTPATNPTGAEISAYHVIRGGSWYNVSDYCLASARNYNVPVLEGNNVGFRVVRR